MHGLCCRYGDVYSHYARRAPLACSHIDEIESYRVIGDYIQAAALSVRHLFETATCTFLHAALFLTFVMTPRYFCGKGITN